MSPMSKEGGTWWDMEMKQCIGPYLDCGENSWWDKKEGCKEVPNSCPKGERWSDKAKSCQTDPNACAGEYWSGGCSDAVCAEPEEWMDYKTGKCMKNPRCDWDKP